MRHNDKSLGNLFSLSGCILRYIERLTAWEGKILHYEWYISGKLRGEVRGEKHPLYNSFRGCFIHYTLLLSKNNRISFGIIEAGSLAGSVRILA